MRHSYQGPEAKLAAGVKAATLITLVGLIAIVAQPRLFTGQEGVVTGADESRPAVVANAAAGSGSEYFPAQFPPPKGEPEMPPQTF